MSPGTGNPPHGELPDSAYRDMTRILRAGLILSLIVLVGGVIAFVLANPSLAFAEMIAGNPILNFLGVSSLASGLASGQIEAYLTLGVLVLVATPIARVLTGCYFFAQNHERELATITAVVAALLLVSVLVVGPLIR